MITQATVYAEPWEARNRLAALGLTEVLLVEAVQVGFSAWASCTPNHPPSAPGYFAWAETVRTLRERLTPLGWERVDEANLPLVINQDRTIALAVSTGSKETGMKGGSPCTTYAKGPMTQGLVKVNRQRELFCEQELMRTGGVIKLDPQTLLFSEEEMMMAPLESPPQRSTWILLVFRGAEEVRCELSLPIGMDKDGYVVGWKERIILPPTGFEPLEPSKKEPTTPEITVEIKKRA